MASSMFRAPATDYKEMDIKQGIDTLYSDAKKYAEKKDAEPKMVAYYLCMPFYASAQTYSSTQVEEYKNLYYQIKADLLQALDKTDDSSFKAWMLGRVILAAKLMNDNETLNFWLPKMKAILEKCVKDNTKDEFTAWAWGYLAALDKKEYKAAKKEMLIEAQDLTKLYHKLYQEQQQNVLEGKSLDEKDEAKLQAALSNALWAHVMNLQAAAKDKDGLTFRMILLEIKQIKGSNSVAEALTKGLLRTAASNDYPAWAIGIVRLAAETLPDKELFNELEEPLKKAIHEAIRDKYFAEATLAQVNVSLIKKMELDEEKANKSRSTMKGAVAAYNA